MNICFIANKYPNIHEPNVLVFYQQLIWAIAEKGHSCSVICPTPITTAPKLADLPAVFQEVTTRGAIITIYRPKTIGLGQSYKVFGKSPVGITAHFSMSVAKKVIESMDEIPDVFYGHFLAPAGVVAARLGSCFDRPAFVAYGEATYKTIDEFGADKLKQEFESLSGFIAVSSQNKNMLINKGIDDGSRIGVFPNSYQPERFHPLDKKECRRRFGFPLDAFIVGFCGSFDERKGVLRLQDAVDKLQDVYFACAGTGKLTPGSKKCLWSKPVNNSELAYFYSSMDVFALPTRNEGCCNAIVEAMACGLPIVSSDLPFNTDILTSENSILVNPNNIENISAAIGMFRDDRALIKRLSAGSLAVAEELNIETRAKNILSFIQERGN